MPDADVLESVVNSVSSCMRCLLLVLVVFIPIFSLAQECDCVEVYISGPDTLCEGNMAELTDSSNNSMVILLWNTGESSKTITISEPGIYRVHAVLEPGCPGEATKFVECGSPRPKIYPNPSSGFFTVANAREVTIFDVTGRQVRSNCGPQIDISEQPSGLYIVKADESFHTVVVTR